MGLPGDRMHSAVRFGLGRFNTQDEVDYVIDRVVGAVKKLRQLSPLYPHAGEKNSDLRRQGNVSSSNA